MRILLSNDDGISSPGLAALERSLGTLGEVWVVAPESEQSAASHAISLHRPLRLTELGPRRFQVDGTPTDCVYIAINHVMRGKKPDLVVSGINLGPNLGDDVTYSGTVAAAMEGTLLGVPSIAMSMAGRPPLDFEAGALFARTLGTEVARRGLPKGVLLNVNVPATTPKGFAMTFLGKRNFGSLVEERHDPRGRRYLWIGGSETRHDDLPGSDCNSVYDHGLISVTPLRLDLTERALLPLLEPWDLPGFPRQEAR